jgi:ketosteroid isomerase-like protein
MTDSNANLATVAEIYAAYNNGVTKPLMDALADDFEMHEHAPVTVPWGGAGHGKDWSGWKIFSRRSPSI